MLLYDRMGLFEHSHPYLCIISHNRFNVPLSGKVNDDHHYIYYQNRLPKGIFIYTHED